MGTITAGAYDIAVTSLRLVDIEARRAHMKLHANGTITEFACHSAACRPPTSGGTGGSLPGGGEGGNQLTRVGQRVIRATKTTPAKAVAGSTLQLGEISPEGQAAMVARLHKVGAIPKHLKTPEQVVTWMEHNIDGTFGQVSPANVAKWRQAYPAYREIGAQLVGPKHDGTTLSHQAANAGIAALSPKTDLNYNIAAAREGFRILKANPALTAAQAKIGNGLAVKSFTTGHAAWVREQVKEGAALKALETEHGHSASTLSKKSLKTLNDNIAAKKAILANPEPQIGNYPHFKTGDRPSDHNSNGAGYFLRIITPNPTVRNIKLNADGTYNDSEVVMTQGTKRKDGTYSKPPVPVKGSWNSYGNLEKFVNIYRGDGSLASISPNLGMDHKVRSFFNNINDPHNKAGDVTIDTHAYGIALGVPLSISHPWIKSGVMNITGTPKSADDGTSGVYALMHEAYRRSALKAGLEPQEMQAVTWMAWREMHPKAARAAGVRKKTTKGT